MVMRNQNRQLDQLVFGIQKGKASDRCLDSPCVLLNLFRLRSYHVSRGPLEYFSRSFWSAIGLDCCSTSKKCSQSWQLTQN